MASGTGASLTHTKHNYGNCRMYSYIATDVCYVIPHVSYVVLYLQYTYVSISYSTSLHMMWKIHNVYVVIRPSFHIKLIIINNKIKTTRE